MGYKDDFPEKSYTVLIEHEILGKSFTEIGKVHGYTSANASRLYTYALRVKKDLYYKEILRKSDISYEMLEVAYRKKRNLYAHLRYAIAFLEEEYGEILTPFREGEPPSSCSLESYLVDFDDPPMTDPHFTKDKNWRDKYKYVGMRCNITLGGYSLRRVELTPIEKQVLDLRIAGHSFIKIGEELRITPEKAKNCYKISMDILKKVSEYVQSQNL